MPKVVLQWWVAEAIKDYVSNYFGITGGLGSGKSHGAGQIFYDRCVANRNSPYSAVMMPTYQRITDTAVPTLFKVFEELGLGSGYHYEYVKSPTPKITFLKSGHEIHFVSANAPEKMVGVEYSHAWVSEPGIMKGDSLDNLSTRIRCPKARINQMILDGVPMALGKYAEMFDTAIKPGWLEVEPQDYRRKSETPFGDRYYRRFRLVTMDNPFLSPDYVASLFETYKDRPEYIQCFVYGYFVALHVGNVYSDYHAKAHDIATIDVDPKSNVDLTFDFNANPVSWVALQKKVFVEYDRLVSRNIAVRECKKGVHQLTDAVAYFANCFPVGQFADVEISVYGDSTGHHSSHKVSRSDYQVVKDILTKLGYRRVIIRAIKYNPSEILTVEAVNEMFRRDELYICDSCPELRRSLLFTKWRENEKKIEKPNQEDWTHYGDALKYWAFVLKHFRNQRVVAGDN